MTKTMIDISYDYRGKRKARQVAARLIPPLAYHPTVGESGFWTVTHIASGNAIYRFLLSCTQAKDIATKLAGLDGWGQPTEQIIADPRLKREVTAVLMAHGVMGGKKGQP